MSKLVLACHIYVDDGWYGDNHRIILTPNLEEGFRTKTEANKFVVRLRKYAQERFSHREANKITNDNITAGELDSFKEYIYVSAGPSVSYTHHHISTTDL